MKRKLLTEKELKDALNKLNGWKVEKGKLYKEYHFGSFIEAFGWMTSVALVAESMNHHPDWFNVYDQVKVNLITHDLGGISTFDIALASQMDQLYLRQRT